MGTRWVRFFGFLIPCRGWGDVFGPCPCVWERNALRTGCRNRTSIAIVKYSLFKLFIFKNFGLSGVCLYRFCGKLVAEVLQVKALILFCVFWVQNIFLLPSVQGEWKPLAKRGCTEVP